LLLLGGSFRQLTLVVTAFTVAHSITLSLAALNILTPPARLIEPAIALSIVYVGADNLLIKDGRDVQGVDRFSRSASFMALDSRTCCAKWICRPARSAGRCSRLNVGVEIGQLRWS
jgi:hypothetical protein